MIHNEISRNDDINVTMTYVWMIMLLVMMIMTQWWLGKP